MILLSKIDFIGFKVSTMIKNPLSRMVQEKQPMAEEIWAL